MTPTLQMPARHGRPDRSNEPGWTKPFALAVGMHALLFALLAIGVAWHTEAPESVEAELWTEPLVSGAKPLAPPAEQPEPPIEQLAQPEPEPPPAPPARAVELPREVPPPPPSVPVAPAKPTQADIALERQRKAEQAQKEAEAAADERKRIEQQKALEQQKLDDARKRQEQLKADQQKAALERQKADDAAKARADAAAKAAADAKAKADADAKAKADAAAKAVADAKAKADADAKAKAAADAKAKADAAAKAADQAAADKRYKEGLARMAALAGGGSPTGVAGATGTGNGASGSGPNDRTAGPRGDGGYGARVAQKIRGNTVFDVPESLSGNPAVVYHVTLDPTGDVMDISKKQSSGVPGFDEAVERAIRKSAPFPPDASGRPPREFDVSHRPKDR